MVWIPVERYSAIYMDKWRNIEPVLVPGAYRMVSKSAWSRVVLYGWSVGRLVGLGGSGRWRHGHGQRGALSVKHLEDQLRVGAGRDRHGARLCEHRLMSTTVRSSRQLVTSARVCQGLLEIIAKTTSFKTNFLLKFTIVMMVNDPCTNNTRADVTIHCV